MALQPKKTHCVSSQLGDWMKGWQVSAVKEQRASMLRNVTQGLRLGLNLWNGKWERTVTWNLVSVCRPG
jgi:hypothetical protein